MILTSEAIAIHWVRYGDNAAVAHFFTRLHGYQSFMVQGLSTKRSSKRQLLQPLSLLEADYRIQAQRDLQRVQAIRRAAVTGSIQTDIVKTSLALFLGEFLYRTLEQHYTNGPLFDYLWQAILHLEQATYPANLHLKILVDLTRFYGIQPQEDPLHAATYLDLETGRFVAIRPGHPYHTSPEQTRLFQTLSGMNFAEAQALNVSRQLRSEMLDRLIEYYQIRYPGLNKLNSRDVFESIFDA